MCVDANSSWSRSHLNRQRCTILRRTKVRENAWIFLMVALFIGLRDGLYYIYTRYLRCANIIRSNRVTWMDNIFTRFYSCDLRCYSAQRMARLSRDERTSATSRSVFSIDSLPIGSTRPPPSPGRPGRRVPRVLEHPVCVHARTYVHISMINRVKRPRSLQSVPPAATRNPCITAGTPAKEDQFVF